MSPQLNKNKKLLPNEDITPVINIQFEQDFHIEKQTSLGKLKSAQSPKKAYQQPTDFTEATIQKLSIEGEAKIINMIQTPISNTRQKVPVPIKSHKLKHVEIKPDADVVRIKSPEFTEYEK